MALDFFAGCVGGCAGVFVGHPFDTVKVKLQTQDYKNPIYKGTWDCFAKILKTESIAGIYRGVSSPMSGVMVVNAIVFGVYGNVQRKMTEPNSLKSHFYAGGLAGLVQSVVASPVELVKTRVQIDKQYKSSIDCFIKTLKGEGVRGVFKGLSITGVREFLGYGVYFATYEGLTQRKPGAAPVGTANMLLAGGVSGTVSWVLTYPLDVIKTRFQADIGKYSGLEDCLRKSIRDEGVMCLTKGLTPTLIRAFPTNAVTFTVVTWVFRLADSISFKDTQNIKGSTDSILDVPHEKSLINKFEFIAGSINDIDLSWVFGKQPQKHYLTSEEHGKRCEGEMNCECTRDERELKELGSHEPHVADGK